MSSFSQFGGSARKSKQRGTVTIADGATTGTQTITAVNTSKADLTFLGASMSSTVPNASPYIALTNSTTVTATRNSVTGVSVASFEVTEYF